MGCSACNSDQVLKLAFDSMASGQVESKFPKSWTVRQKRPGSLNPPQVGIGVTS